MVSPTQFRSVSSLSSERILTLPPAHDRTSLSSFGGEGWGEEAALSESHRRPGLQTRRCPSPQPSPRARLAGRGRNLWWQCQDAPPANRPDLELTSPRKSASIPSTQRFLLAMRNPRSLADHEISKI